MWQDIILYTFLCYLLFHLIIDDILLMIRFFKKRNDTLPETHLSDDEQRTVIKILFKICDVVLQCVMGYFDAFKTCWTKSTDCLQTVMLRYIEFLETLSKKLLEYPTCAFTCASGVLMASIACIMLWVILD